MVKELRKIILSRDECIAALESYKRTNFEFLPAGKIASVDLKAGSSFIVGIETASGTSVKITEFKLEPPKLLEPLIRFCIEHNIVLPRNSRKSALTGDDQAVLYIQIGSENT